jgi:hypothetical protein
MSIVLEGECFIYGYAQHTAIGNKLGSNTSFPVTIA